MGWTVKGLYYKGIKLKGKIKEIKWNEKGQNKNDSKMWKDQVSK